MKRIRKAISLVLAMIMVLALVPTALAAENTAPAEGAETTAADYDGWDTIKVFETTDVHGFLMDISTYEEATFQYRMAYIAKIVNDARANEDYAGVLLLDSGDIYQGNVVSSKNDEGAPMRAAFDVMGYDAVGLGNHEFDKDVTKYAADEEGTMPAYNFGEYEGDSDIPVLMYNLYDAGTTNRVNFTQDYTVVEKGGYKVAILGYAGDYSEEIMASKIAPYDIDEDLEKLSARAAEVKEESEADILVILAHHSPDEIAAAMDPEVVDLVAGGHSHKNLTGVAENGVTYIQCRNQARNYATAEIKVNPETKEVAVVNPAYETVYDSENKEILYYNDGKNENLDPEVVALSRAAWENIKEEMSEVLITIDQDVTRDPMNENTTTSMAGNWQTGLMLEATKNLGTIAAFTNTGGIRVPYELEEGAEVKEITVADIYNMMNFDNQIVSFAITGQQMAQHLEMAMRGVDHLDANFGDQFSGIVVEYYDVMENGEKTGIKVTKITTDEGEEIDITDNEKTYNVCINSYCIGVSGSIFEGMTPLQDLYEAPVDNVSAIEILKAYAEENGPAYELDTTVRAVKVEAPATEAPAEPEKPEAPAETTPAEPAEPETPAEPEKPAEPETPAQPETPAPQPEPAPAEPAEGTTYVVAAGDCLWKIAAKLYGSGERWGEIYEANKATIKDPQMIYIGQELLIP